MENETKIDTEVEATNVETEKKPVRKVTLTIAQIEEMAAEPKLTKAFLEAYKIMPDAIAPIIMATAKGMLAQLKIKL